MRITTRYIFILSYMTILSVIFLTNFIYATNSFQIIPEPRENSAEKIQEAINNLNNVYSTWRSQTGKTDFWTEYNKWAESLNWDLWAQLKTGMFTWESILNIGVYFIRFLMQIAMVIWAWFIIRWWYQSVMVAFWWGSADNRRKYIKNIFAWVVIIAFSYTIIKLLVMAFLS